MEPEKISVIIPAYNAEDTIERCILSITRGGYQNIEVIVVNDGSTDKTEEIVKGLCQNDNRIDLISQENQGPAGSRGTGLKEASGDYIAWCDSDDWVESEWLNTMYQYLHKYSADMVVCGTQIPGRKSEHNINQVTIWEDDEAIDAFLEHKNLNGVLWNKLCKKELYAGAGFDRSMWYWEDLHVVWNMVKKATRIVRFEIPLYNFYIHEGSICAKMMNENRLYCDFKIFDEILTDCKKENMKAHYENARRLQARWLYGELKLMFRDQYYDKPAEKRIQHLMRETQLSFVQNINGASQKLFAVLAMISLPMARLIYGVMGRRNG